MGFRDRIKNTFGLSKYENSTDEIQMDGADSDKIRLSCEDVLFVCNSNTVISPMAEAIFNQFSGDRKAFSAGLKARKGNRAPKDAIKVCQEYGIELSGHLTANINDFFLDDAGLILTSTAHVRDALKIKFPYANIFTIREYAGGYSDLDILCSFNEGLAGYGACFMKINEAVIKIIRKDMGAGAEEIVERPAAIDDESVQGTDVLSDGRLIVVSGLDGNLDYYNQYLSLWDNSDPHCHIVFLGNLIYSTEDNDGSIEILDDAIEKSQNYFNFHYLLGINELSCIMGENIYKMGIDLKTKFENLIVSKKGSLEPHLGRYVDFFKKLPYFLKTENGLFLSYSGPSETVESLEEMGSDLNLLHDFLWARKGQYESGDVEEFLDTLGLNFMVVGNMPCDYGYDIFSRQLIISSGPFGENDTYLDVDLSEDIDSMDTLVGCLKSIGGVVKVIDYPVAVEGGIEEVPSEGDLEDEYIVGNPIKVNDFKYLDDLIHSGVSEIVLDSDIVLKYWQKDEYADHGIEIDVDELVIDGRGHSIDARRRAPIFFISSNANVTIKNIKFRNGFAKEGGAICSEGKLTVTESVFENNKAHDEEDYEDLIYDEEDYMMYTQGVGGAICSRGDLTVMESSFINNFSNDGGAIYSGGKLTVTESVFENNKAYEELDNFSGDNLIAHGKGGAISVHSDSDISQSIFINNFACDGGAIYNPSELTVTESTFKRNSSGTNGGAITNTGILNMRHCEISYNASPQEIIGINKYSQIYNSLFKGNDAQTIIDNHGSKATFGIFYTKFIENEVKSAIVSNQGRYGFIESVTFQSNHLNNGSRNIINGNDLTIVGIEIAEEKSILNDGYLLIKKSSQNIEDIIEGEGNLAIYEKMIPKEHRFDFGHLDKKIHESDSKEIVLDHDITFEMYEREFYEGGVELDIDGLTIDGKGKTIDAKGKSRFFIITGSNITLKNIVFKNGYFYENIMYPLKVGGGALKIIQNSNLTIENCKFINNVSEDNCGAIDNAGNVTVIESEFDDNMARGCAGAIYNWGRMDIIKSSLQNNAADNSGGAAYNLGAMDIIDSSLQNNATGNHGGVAYNLGELKFLESTFSNNKSKRGGGVAYNEGELDILESSLQNNVANGRGGVAYNVGELKFLDSTFSNNKSKRRGGVAYNEGALNIVESKLINNNAHLHGGGVYSIDKVTVSGTVFQGNLSRYSGGALYAVGESDISESVFESNSSGYDGGGLYNVGESVISESVFESNSCACDGGGLFNKGDLTLSGSTFKSNVSDNEGGGLFNLGKSDVTDVSILNSNFNENNAKKRGGAIFSLVGKLNIVKSKFNGNEVRVEGGAIYNLNAPLSIDKTVFTGNSSNESAGAIFNNNGEMDMSDCEIKGNKARVDAGAIVNMAELKISKSSIMNNETMGIGGAIVNTAYIYISESEVSHNSAMHMAGAIDNYKGSVTISESVFAANEVKWDGGVTMSETVFEGGEWNGSGVIYNDEGNLAVFDSTFADNAIMGRESKAIWSNNPDCNVVDCNFENNHLENIEFEDENNPLDDVEYGDENVVLDDESGSLDDVEYGDEDVVLDDERDQMDFKDESGSLDDVGLEDESNQIEFEDEKDIDDELDDDSLTCFRYLDKLIHSGAERIDLEFDIVSSDLDEFRYSNGIMLDVDDLIIDGRGHTIDARGKSRIFHCTGKNVSIKNVFLTNGSAEVGGAIYNEGELTISASTLNDNDAQESGGAVCNDDGELTVVESEFKNNSAHYGGAIRNVQGTLNISKSRVLSNRASSSGGAISNGCIADIEETEINHNTANRGGAITNNGKMTVKNSVVRKNTAEQYYGGAIDNGEELTIIDSEITDNFAERDGGAIHNNCADLTLIGSSFSGNRANENGDAIFNYRERSFEVQNCDLLFWDVKKYNEYDGGD